MNEFKKLKMVKKLSDLKENGIIDEAEFEIRKEKILNKKPFWTKDKIIIASVALLLVASASTISVNYINKVNAEKVAQVITLKKEQNEKKKAQTQLDNYEKTNNSMDNLDTQLMSEYGDFEDSAFGSIYYINFPNYYAKWNSSLDSIKSQLSQFTSDTNQVINFPDNIKKELLLEPHNIDSIKTLYESRYNDFVIIVKNYNTRLNDYDNWAKNYTSSGEKADYLDPYTAGGYTSEIDFNKNGKFESLENLTQ
jgi:hypothetical protein